MNYQQANFADLKEQYHDRGPARWAVGALNRIRKGAKKPDLVHLLRHHDEEPISDRETYHRDSVDFLWLITAFWRLLH